jgi:hypothetical protein
MKEKGHKMERLSNLDIERGILSAILFDAEFEKVKNILDKKDFYLPFHRDLFEAMGVLNDKNYPIDEIMLREELTKHNKFDEALMSEVITMAPIEMIEVYAATIKELSSKRQLNKLLDKGKIKLLDDNDTDTLAIIMEMFVSGLTIYGCLLGGRNSSTISCSGTSTGALVWERMNPSRPTIIGRYTLGSSLIRKACIVKSRTSWFSWATLIIQPESL